MNNLIKLAENYGMINFAQGIMRVPAQSSDFINMLQGRQIGQTPDGGPTTIKLAQAWTRGWDKAKRADMKARFGF